MFIFEFIAYSLGLGLLCWIAYRIFKRIKEGRY